MQAYPFIFIALSVLILLSGCPSEPSGFFPLGQPQYTTIRFSQAFSLPTGTEVTILRDYTIRDEDLNKLVGQFWNTKIYDNAQFFLDITIPPTKENTSLEDAKICLYFDKERIASLVVVTNGLSWNPETNCFHFGSTQVYQPDGWTLKLLGTPQKIENDSFVGTPITVEATGKDYLARNSTVLQIYRNG